MTELATWRPEHHALCRFVRGAAASDATGQHARGADLNWPLLLATAERHAVVEPLAAAIAHGSITVPAAVAAQLADRRVRTAAANLRHLHQLTGVLELLRTRGIAALTFRGPLLAAEFYGSLAHRASADLDLLAAPRDARRIRPLLMARGYTLPPRRRHRGGSLLQGLLPAAGRDDTLLPPTERLAPVDVHATFAFWTLGMRLEPRALLARARLVTIAGCTLPTLAHADLILVLAIHGMMHGWAWLRHVRDIDAVAPSIEDWTAVRQAARAARVTRVLRVALLLSHRVFATAIPADVLTWAHDDEAAVLVADEVLVRLFAQPDDWDPRSWQLTFMETRVARWRYEARTLVYEWFLKWPWDEWLGRRNAPEEA